MALWLSVCSIIVVELGKGARLEELAKLHELEDFKFRLKLECHGPLFVDILTQNVNTIALSLSVLYGCVAKIE